MQRYRAKASRSKSQVSMAWASRTRVRAHAASEGNSASVPAGSAPGGPRRFIGVESPLRRRKPGPRAPPRSPATDSCGDQPLAWTLERSVGIEVGPGGPNVHIWTS